MGAARSKAWAAPAARDLPANPGWSPEAFTGLIGRSLPQSGLCRQANRCAPPDHEAAGYTTTTDDGRPMSINVEMIGTGLVIQHYVAEVAEKQHCHMVSLSDVFTPRGWTTVQVIWDLSVKPLDANSCEYINQVTSHPTTEFIAFIEKNGTTFEDAAAARQAASGDHNRRETPLFAASIGRRALARK